MSKGRILAVDDQRYFRGLLEGLLSEEGYEVVTAASGEEALRLMEQIRFDILLTDLVMPGMDGKELYDKIIALKPDVPVIFHSGYHLAREYTDYINKRGLRLLRKPYSSAALLQAVYEGLGKPREG